VRIVFTEAAQADLAAIFDYYNTERQGLGYEFAAEVDAALDRIQQMPHAWTQLEPSIRLCRTKRFPFGIVYRVSTEVCTIASIVHLHSDPGSWPKRYQT
jgi:plasmid stabilization system protein ParE